MGKAVQYLAYVSLGITILSLLQIVFFGPVPSVFFGKYSELMFFVFSVLFAGIALYKHSHPRVAIVALLLNFLSIIFLYNFLSMHP